jgi:hypothetical protein
LVTDQRGGVLNTKFFAPQTDESMPTGEITNPGSLLPKMTETNHHQTDFVVQEPLCQFDKATRSNAYPSGAFKGEIRKHRIGKAKHRQRTKPPEKGKLDGGSERRKIGDPPSATFTDSIGVLKFLGSVY